MLSSSRTSLPREDISYTTPSKDLPASQSFTLHQELAGAKLRPAREQGMTFAREGVSGIENYFNC